MLAMHTTLRNTLVHHGINGLEIEVRLGHKVGTRFQPGVSEATACRISSALNSSSAFHPLPATESVDYYFDVPGRLEMPREVWVLKDRVGFEDHEGYRVACAYERLMTRPAATDPAHSKFFRKKHRVSFEWTEGGWRVDITRVESNEDTDAEAAWEVEAEFVRTTDVYFVPLHIILESGERLARDLLKL